MYKVILLIRGAECFDASELTQCWIKLPWPSLGGLHAPVRHVHNSGIPGAKPIENAPAAKFNAIDEFWFVDQAAARDWFGSGSVRQFWGTRCATLLSGSPLALSGVPHLLWERAVAQSSDPVKIITLPVRREGMTAGAFAHHWIHVHSELALGGPGTRERLQRLESCPAEDDNVTGFPTAPFDGAGTIEFADRRDLQAEFDSEHYRTVMAPDEPRFTNPSSSCALMVRPFEV